MENQAAKLPDSRVMNFSETQAGQSMGEAAQRSSIRVLYEFLQSP